MDQLQRPLPNETDRLMALLDDDLRSLADRQKPALGWFPLPGGNSPGGCGTWDVSGAGPAKGRSMEWFALVLAALLGQVARPAAVPEKLDVDTVLAYLRSSADQDQLIAMQRFAKQSDAPQAIPRLLAEMRKNAPNLDNNVGLQVEFILHSHPQAPCDMAPLLEGIRRKIWNSQQKCAQALAPLLERGDGKGHEQELAKDLIPLLASQRPRVFQSAQNCLKGLTHQDLGNTPNRWLEWYADEFGDELDMSGAVWEDLVVVRSSIVQEGGAKKPHIEIDKVPVPPEELKVKLTERKNAAKERDLELGVSIQISNERMNQFGTSKDQATDFPDVMAAMSTVHSLGMSVVISPELDAFRAPWKPGE
jgi:hypothetical protein